MDDIRVFVEHHIYLYNGFSISLYVPPLIKALYHANTYPVVVRHQNDDIVYFIHDM